MVWECFCKSLRLNHHGVVIESIIASLFTQIDIVTQPDSKLQQWNTHSTLGNQVCSYFITSQTVATQVEQGKV